MCAHPDLADQRPGRQSDVAHSLFLFSVHPYRWCNGLIAKRNVAVMSGLLLPLGCLARLGWHFSSVLLLPAPDTNPAETALLWPTGPDPAAVGLRFADVSVPGPLGDYPAWLVPADQNPANQNPATADTWVVTVHGRGGDRRESLRVLPTLHRLGHPVLVISYRNDVGAPPGPDGLYHLGDTEWADLAAAVRYARTRGARRVVLYGWSMGAAIIGAYLERAEQPLPVVAMVWDSPLVDWRATLRQQAALRRLPAVLTRTAMQVTRWRIGIDFDRFDLIHSPPRLRPPTLLLHGAADTGVPPGPSRALAATARRLGWPMHYIEVPGAEHTATWNVDPPAYESAVAQFLTRYAGPSGASPGE